MAHLNRSVWEGLALIGICIIVFFIFIQAFLYNRQVVRDDLRKDDVTNVKRALEAYYNIHEFYVTPPIDQEPCTQSNDPNSWFFGNASALLKDHVIDALPHDIREEHGRFYTYCVTHLDASKKASGYYIEAQIEVDQNDRKEFDEDEDRKFHYRVLHENGQPLYRICGGAEPQCNP